MTQQFRKWAVVVIASALVAAVWGILAWKVFQLFFDRDYHEFSSPEYISPFAENSQIISTEIDINEIKQQGVESISKINSITEQINKSIREGYRDNDSLLDELYLMHIEDDVEKNQYVVTLKWPEAMSDNISFDVNDTELIVTMTPVVSAAVEHDNDFLAKKRASGKFQGLIELPGPGSNTGARHIKENDILMIFIPKKQ